MKADKINQFNIKYIVLQGLCTIISFVCVIMSFFQPDIKYFIPFSFGLTLFVLSLNNYKIYHRKFFTILYFLFGILSILYGIIRWRI